MLIAGTVKGCIGSIIKTCELNTFVRNSNEARSGLIPGRFHSPNDAPMVDWMCFVFRVNRALNIFFPSTSSHVSTPVLQHQGIQKKLWVLREQRPNSANPPEESLIAGLIHTEKSPSLGSCTAGLSQSFFQNPASRYRGIDCCMSSQSTMYRSSLLTLPGARVRT